MLTTAYQVFLHQELLESPIEYQRKEDESRKMFEESQDYYTSVLSTSIQFSFILGLDPLFIQPFWVLPVHLHSAFLGPSFNFLPSSLLMYLHIHTLISCIPTHA